MVLSLETLPARSRSPATALVQLSPLPLPPPTHAPPGRPPASAWLPGQHGASRGPWTPPAPLVSAGSRERARLLHRRVETAGGDILVGEAEANRGLGHRASPSARQDEVAFLAVAWGPGGPPFPSAASAALGRDRASWGRHRPGCAGWTAFKASAWSWSLRAGARGRCLRGRDRRLLCRAQKKPLVQRPFPAGVGGTRGGAGGRVKPRGRPPAGPAQASL